MKAASRDSEIEYLDYNADGLPQRTVQRRFANSSGSSGSTYVDAYERSFKWNVHGERSEWTLPSYRDMTAPGAWTKKISFGYDAAGNTTSMTREMFDGTTGVAFLTGTWHSAGRPATRVVKTCGSIAPTCGTQKEITREYGYTEAEGLPSLIRVKSGTTEIAGSEITAFDGPTSRSSSSSAYPAEHGPIVTPTMRAAASRRV